MSMKNAALAVLLTVAVIACKTGPTNQVVAATPADYITDNAKVIDESTRKQLETTLTALKERKKIDFAVVTVETTGDKTVADYSLELARQRKKDSIERNVSGLLLLVAVEDRSWHIQITNNLEAHLTKEILTNLSTPMIDSFRQKQYGAGILKYVNAIIAKLNQFNLQAQKTQKMVLVFHS